jgi:hypothetical protein
MHTPAGQAHLSPRVRLVGVGVPHLRQVFQLHLRRRPQRAQHAVEGWARSNSCRMMRGAAQLDGSAAAREECWQGEG